MSKVKNHLDNLKHYENEKGMLGGMAYDEVGWEIHFLVDDHGYSEKQLIEMFPKLLGHLKEK